MNQFKIVQVKLSKRGCLMLVGGGLKALSLSMPTVIVVIIGYYWYIDDHRCTSFYHRTATKDLRKHCERLGMLEFISM